VIDVGLHKSPYRCELQPFRSLTALESDWHNLESSSTTSFFQSWSWISSWLSALPKDIRPLVLTVFDGPELVGLGLVVNNQGSFYLNETGVGGIDALCIEHNMLLARKGIERQVLECAAHFLLYGNHQCKKLYVSGISQDITQFPRAFNLGGERTQVDILSQAPFYTVDLVAAVPYESQLSRNTRYQIKRSLRKYSLFGEVKLSFPQDIAEAEVFFKRMTVLHRQSWDRKGQDSGFLSEFSQRFHWDMVTKQYDAGGINLVRVMAGEHEIGYLYLLLKGGVVSVYQTGFHYEASGQFKPGLVSHYLAILYYQNAGYKAYDLLAGKSQYKNSLSTDQGEMVWLVFSPNQLWSGFRRRVMAILAWVRLRVGH
jgi:CelD/BcsL family acetyltransferase involved in cellulose biosynthesis